ncbi:Long-chain-alcohol oxidase FAO2 [Cytospora mali]|uniref:Long-chain-alcohol oxidase n=1 Tax=Cytospora mali TaxID=578113 RepID=A0A194W0T2_CYTMA|nr:Long-chain-alcohol oxidase FAO2 [Valsa mali]
MAEEASEVLTAQRPTGIPWRFKTEEIIPDRQWRMLMAIMDAILPSIQRESTTLGRKSLSKAYISDSRYQEAVSGFRRDTFVLDSASEQDLDKYLSERPTDDLLFQQVLKGMLHYVPQETRSILFHILYILSTHAGALLLTGYATPMTRLSIEDRTKILNNWSNSYLYQIRGLFRQLTTLGRVVFTSTNPTFHALSGFPNTPTGWKPQPKHPYEFIQFPPPPPSSSQSTTPPAEVETDVVIVGSGCGAGVCAKTLSEAGHRVLVVDKGYHFDAPSLPMAGSEAFFHLFDGAATVSSDDASILVVSGSCFGGGGTINWGASLQTQGFVREEWANERGLGFFGTQEFQACLDRVCGQMGVHEVAEPNFRNGLLVDGARKLGWSAKKVPQNSGGCEHPDGHCAFGCAAGQKKGPVDGWFPDAAGKGAMFVEGFKVDRVLFDEKVKSRRAVGVVGTWTSRGKEGKLDGPDDEKIVREVIVRAKKVIISSGTMWSPNPQIGRNLYLHPVSIMHGFFKEDVRPWEGDIITTVVNSFENLDGKGHGVKLECLSMMPCFALQFLNWSDGIDWKLLALKYRHLSSYFALVRDRDTGYVYPDPHSGQPRVVYTPSAFDRKHGMIGAVALAKILYLQGALEIHAALPGMRPFIRNEASPSTTSTSQEDGLISRVSEAGVADPHFKAWLNELEAHGNKPPLAPFGSAHQMGTCRMSTSEKTGVVDPRGRVWGTEGLYVSDASVFPSASGVNPMVTNMAISDWISRNVVEDIRRDGNRERRAQL